MKLINLKDKLDRVFQIELAEEWDNTGFLIGRLDKEVNRVLLVLELTREILEESILKDVDLVIAHHPLIFTAVKQVIDNNDNLIYQLIQKDIGFYCAHTNFDKMDRGTNDYFAELLGGQSINKVADIPSEFPMLRVFDIQRNSIQIIAKNIKETLSISHVKLIGNKNQLVSKLGVVTGSGGDYARLAAENGVELFITGDIRYHQAMEFIHQGINVLDIGHFESEKIFSKAAMSIIKGHNDINNLELLFSECEISPFEMI